MVDIVQLVERQIVALEVVGSSPTIHPINFMLGYSQVVRHETLTLASVGSNPATPAILLLIVPLEYGLLAQLVEHMTFNHGVPRSNRG